MAKLLFKTTLLVVVFLMGESSADLFTNTNYNKYGTNPYLAPVFNSSSPSESNPTALPDVQTNLPSLSNAEQGVTENEESAVSSIPQEIQNPNEVAPSEANNSRIKPENSEAPLSSSSLLPEISNDVVPASVPQNIAPPLQPVVPVQANPVSAFQNPQNAFYPAAPAFISSAPPSLQNNFGSSQASFPAPNYSNNPYLQGLLPGGGNQPQKPPQNNVNLPPQNAASFPPVLPPQNVIPVQPPQNAVPLPPASPPQNINNPFLQNQTPLPNPPQSSSNVPIQSPQVSPAPGGFVNNPYPQNQIPNIPPQNSPNIPSAAPGGIVNVNNNPYLQNLNPAVQPQGAIPSNQNPSNVLFPSVPVSSIPQQPTQSYPTPCTYIPNAIPSNTQTFVPAQGITYQPQNYPSTIAAKHLRSRCLKPRGQFPSDKCNYFINCWDHDVREQPCPPGLAFSSKGYCDFEGNVDCNGLPLVAVPVTGSPEGGVSYINQGSFVPVQVPVASQPDLPSALPTVQNPEPTAQPSSDDQKPAISSTNQSSSSSILTSVLIASNEVSSQTLSNTPSPQGNPAVTIPAAFPTQNVPISSSFSPTAAPIPQTTVDPALKAKCLKPRGQFPTEICNRYINCWDDVVRIEECPKGMSFSEKGYCDFDFSVNCGNRTYERKEIKGTADCPTLHGTFRDKLNCSQYYTCMFGEIVARYACAYGLSYNDMLGVCDYSTNVDCTQAPLVYPPTQNHIVMQEIKDGAPNTSKCTPGSIYRLNPQCTSVALCRYGFTEIVECPPGLAYDSLTDKCLMPHLAKC